MRWFFARTIVEDDSVSQAVDEYTGKFSRFDEAYDALKWLLARKCDEIETLCREVGGEEYHLYRQAADELAKTPAIVVLFQFDGDNVFLIGLRAELASEPDE